MAETDITDAQAEALWGTDDSDSGFEHFTPSEDYRHKGTRNNVRLNLMAAVSNGLRILKDGDLTYEVQAGLFMNGDTAVSYAGATAQGLANNDTNYIYLTAAGSLVDNTTGFPVMSTTPHIPLATILTAAGTYAYTDITDYRQRTVFQVGVVREQLAQDDAESYQTPITAFRVWDAPSSILPATAATDDLGLIDNTFGTAAPTLETSDAKATSVTQYGRFQFAVPPEYVDGETVALRINAGMKTTISDATATLDVELVRQAAAGTDICATAATDINSLTPADKDFTITPATIVAGDLLDVRLTIAITDGATGTAVIGQINTVEFLLDIKG